MLTVIAFGAGAAVGFVFSFLFFRKNPATAAQANAVVAKADAAITKAEGSLGKL